MNAYNTWKGNRRAHKRLKEKEKVKVKVKLTLQQAMKSPGGE